MMKKQMHTTNNIRNYKFKVNYFLNNYKPNRKKQISIIIKIKIHKRINKKFQKILKISQKKYKIYILTKNRTKKQ